MSTLPKSASFVALCMAVTAQAGVVTFSPDPQFVPAGTTVMFDVSITSLPVLGGQFEAVDMVIGAGDGLQVVGFSYSPAFVAATFARTSPAPQGIYPSDVLIGGVSFAPLLVPILIGTVTVDTFGLPPGGYTVMVDALVDAGISTAYFGPSSSEPLFGSGQVFVMEMCGNNVREGAEQCDGTDDGNCPGMCRAPGHPAGECVCAFCGDAYADPGEECDGSDDGACPGLCSPSCTCPSGCANKAFVDAAATGTNDGSSWVNAYPRLRDALDDPAVCEIWVADGTYKPTDKSCVVNADCPSDVCIVPPGTCSWTQPRAQTFQLRSGLALYGGFRGSACVGGTRHGLSCAVPADCPGSGVCDVGETMLSQRDSAANQTILSGDVNGDDGGTSPTCCTAHPTPGCDDPVCQVLVCGSDPFCCLVEWDRLCAVEAGALCVPCGDTSENSYHVVTSNGTDATAILDGFRIRDGNANGPFPDSVGGGLVNDGSPTLRNCTFVGNSAESMGGGIDNRGGTPTLIDCTFSGNQTTAANSAGGAISNQGSNATLVNCRFIENRTGYNGGAIFVSFSDLTVTNCIFVGNSGFAGGAINTGFTGNPTLTNCTFSGNQAVFGGGIYNVNNTPTMTNCTFSGNKAGLGGGMFHESNTSTLTNCVFWGNTDDAGTDESAQIHIAVGSVAVNRSVIQGLTGGLGGVGNIGSDPLIFDPDGADNVVGTIDDNLSLRFGSPAIDAGDTTALPLDAFDLDGDADTTERIPIDLASNPRQFDDPATPDTGVPGSPVADMGAYEFFTDCNDNGIPDECDVSCVGFSCSAIPGCGTSQDIRPPIGVPDECVTTTGGGSTINWSDGTNWPLDGKFPDNIDPVNGVPQRYVTIDGVTIFLDRTVQVNSLTLINGARLLVIQVDSAKQRGPQTAAGDLEVLRTLVNGGTVEVANNRTITVGDQLTVAANGKYMAAAGAGVDGCPSGSVCASLTAASVRLEPGDCPLAVPSFGGEIALSGDMSLISTGPLTVIGSPSPFCPASAGSVADARGITPPPKFTVRNLAAVAAASASFSGAVDTQVNSSDPVVFAGFFDNDLQFPGSFDWSAGTVQLAGPVPFVFEVAGLDLGPSSAGFATNFSIGRLVLDPGLGEVSFVNERVNTAPAAPCAEALYVDTLETIGPVVLHLDHVRVYYRTLVGPPGPVDLIGCGALQQVQVCPIGAAPSSEAILAANDTIVPSVKNRFLSFSGGDPGLSQAVRVTFVSLAGVFNVFNGTTAWVDLPFAVSELPGKGLSDPIGTEATFMAARLSVVPVYADWSMFGVVHVYDEKIIPSRKVGANPLEPAVYEVQIVTEGCDVGSEASFSPALPITNARWGDVASLSSGQFRAPDGNVDVTADVLAVLAKFSNAAGAPSKARAELVGTGVSGPQAAITGKIEISDVLAVLGAFSGGSYPFPPP